MGRTPEEEISSQIRWRRKGLGRRARPIQAREKGREGRNYKRGNSDDFTIRKKNPFKNSGLKTLFPGPVIYR